jgi:hypothetical protein
LGFEKVLCPYDLWHDIIHSDQFRFHRALVFSF